jgi:hypothetical protein
MASKISLLAANTVRRDAALLTASPHDETDVGEERIASEPCKYVTQHALWLVVLALLLVHRAAGLSWPTECPEIERLNPLLQQLVDVPLKKHKTGGGARQESETGSHLRQARISPLPS